MFTNECRAAGKNLILTNENEKLIAGFQRKIKIERRTETIVEGVKSCKSSNDVRKWNVGTEW